MSETKCHWNGEQRVTHEHGRDCNASGCEGCKPCGEDHCRCGRHLRNTEPLTCAKCVGNVRTHLKRIEGLCRLAPLAATEAGTGSAAMVLASPVPEHSTHAARRTWAYKGGLCRCVHCPDDQPALPGPVCKKSLTCVHHVCRKATWRPTCPGLVDWLEYADDERHPLWVLGSWDMLITEHLEHDRTDRVTIASAVKYLDANLTYLAQDRDFAFDELAREIRGCTEHVEQVMCVADYQQRGAPCPACRAAGRPAKSLERQYAPGQEDDTHDEWKCPTKACGKNYEPDEYGRTVYVDYLSNADRLTAAQMLAQYRVAEGTLRRWANGWTDRYGIWHEPTVRKHGYDGERRQLYNVADTLQMRDNPAA
jgi:hypothetical protein